MSPLVEAIGLASTDRDRAGMLLAMPLAVLWESRCDLIDMLDSIGFAEGREAVAAEVALMSARRLPDGGHGPTTLMAVHVTRSALRTMAGWPRGDE